MASEFQSLTILGHRAHSMFRSSGRLPLPSRWKEIPPHRPFIRLTLKDGLVYRWSDYWDMQKFVGQFPPWFLEEMMKSTAEDFSD